MPWRLRDKAENGQLPYRSLYMVVGDTVRVIAVRGAGEVLVTVDDVELPT